MEFRNMIYLDIFLSLQKSIWDDLCNDVWDDIIYNVNLDESSGDKEEKEDSLDLKKQEESKEQKKEIKERRVVFLIYPKNMD